MSSMPKGPLMNNPDTTNSTHSHADGVGSSASATTVDSVGAIKPSYSVRRNSSFGARKFPSLEDILNAGAPPPFDLPAFLAFAASNHCVEAVEFLVAAAHYCTAYYRNHKNNSNNNSSDKTNKIIDDNTALWTEWTKIVDTFVQPHCAKEVNLTCQARSGLLQQKVEHQQRRRLQQLPNETLLIADAPSPATLDHACDVVREMVKDNLYLAFVLSRKSGVTAVTAPSGNEMSGRHRASSASIASSIYEEEEQQRYVASQQLLLSTPPPQKHQAIPVLQITTPPKTSELNKPQFEVTNSRSSSFSSSTNDVSSGCAISNSSSSSNSSSDESPPSLISRPSWTRKLSMRFKRRP